MNMVHGEFRRDIFCLQSLVSVSSAGPVTAFAVQGFFVVCQSYHFQPFDQYQGCIGDADFR